MSERSRFLAVGEDRSRIVVALHRVVPVVETVLEVADFAVRVSHVPAGDEDLFEIGLTVAVGVLEIDRFGPVLHDHTAAIERDGGWDTELVGEDRELVGDPIAVGVFADADAVAALALRLEFVRVVERLTNPETAPLVPIHGDRLALKVLLRSKQLHFKTDRRDEVLHRLFGRRGELHLALGVFLCPPIFAGRIERNAIGLDVLERLEVFGERRDTRLVRERTGGTRVLPAGVTDAPFDKVVKAGVRERPGVVSPGGVKDAALPVSPHPRPRLLPVPFRARLQHRAVFFVVLRVNVGLIPAFKALEALHHGMLGQSDRRPKRAGPVTQELRPDQLHHVLVVAEAVARAVQRHEALARRDVIKQRLGLVRFDGVDVRVHDHAVIRLQRGRIQITDDIRIREVNPALLHHGLKLLEPHRRLMMPTVPQIKQFQLRRNLRRRGTRDQ